jgi:hypothetical protein
VIDTVENYVVSKTRYKESHGCWHFHVIRQTTITYNKQHKKVEKYILRNGKKKTIEYFKNYQDVTINSDSPNLQADTIKTKK